MILNFVFFNFLKEIDSLKLLIKLKAVKKNIYKIFFIKSNIVLFKIKRF